MNFSAAINRNRRARKKGKKQQQKQPLWQQAIVQVPVETPVVELTDDTSPGNPGLGPWTPVGGDEVKKKKDDPPTTSGLAERWRKFQASFQKVELNHENRSESKKQNAESEQESDTTEQQSNQTNKDNNPIVVRGRLNEIKIVVKEQQHTTVTVDNDDFTADPIFPDVDVAPLRRRVPEKQLPQPKGPRYPAGVPRSFLERQQNIMGSIEPQGGFKKPSPNIPEVPEKAPATIVSPLTVDTNNYTPQVEESKTYSPSDSYEQGDELEDDRSSVSSGQKRLSAFQRLGPMAEAKKPKLQINVMCKEDQSVREVVDVETEPKKFDKFAPVHRRDDILTSTDEVVMKYVIFWPWKRNVGIRKSASARNSKTVMILEREQMEEFYDKDNQFIGVSVSGYPLEWDKEDVLDMVLESVKGTFIPCFIEFSREECKFLVLRSKPALSALHRMGLVLTRDDIDLRLTISVTDILLQHLDFIPRLILRKRLAQAYNDVEGRLSLKAFTLQPDFSHFMYYPLNRVTNQVELVQLPSAVAWLTLTHLDLSHNRITNIDSFNLLKTTPKLKHLDLSYNRLDKIIQLIQCRGLALKSIKLEGNPLCHNYIDPDEYVEILRTMFSSLTHIDDVKICYKGDLPTIKRNYCPKDAVPVVEGFVEVLLALLEADPGERGDRAVQQLYDEAVVMTVTFQNNMRSSSVNRVFRNLFMRSRSLLEGIEESVCGAAEVARLMGRWPPLRHDPHSITVDVMHHDEYTTILRMDGILKVTVESLADDEPLLAFTRTVVLGTKDGVEYKVLNEMVYWGSPTRESSDASFRITSMKPKRISLKLDHPPDEELKEQLSEILMKITYMDKKASKRCLELKDWNLRSALEYYMKLVKMDNIGALNSGDAVN